MKQLTVLLPALIIGAVFFSPTVAYADHPWDTDWAAYHETTTLDPVQCLWTRTLTESTREPVVDPETFEEIGATDWSDPVVIEFEQWEGTADAPDADCPDWHVDADGEWYYEAPAAPAPVDIVPPVDAPDPVVGDGIVWKVGLAVPLKVI